MRFAITPEALTCDLSEDGRHILTLHVVRQGFSLRDKKPLTTFSVRNRNLIETVIPNNGTFRMAVNPMALISNWGIMKWPGPSPDWGLPENLCYPDIIWKETPFFPRGASLRKTFYPLTGTPEKMGKGGTKLFISPWNNKHAGYNRLLASSASSERSPFSRLMWA
jgi:hypothetical protein